MSIRANPEAPAQARQLLCAMCFYERNPNRHLPKYTSGPRYRVTLETEIGNSDCVYLFGFCRRHWAVKAAAT